jgi:hypothetical protein
MLSQIMGLQCNPDLFPEPFDNVPGPGVTQLEYFGIIWDTFPANVLL